MEITLRERDIAQGQKFGVWLNLMVQNKQQANARTARSSNKGLRVLVVVAFWCLENKGNLVLCLS